ncbi:hypothetical protein BDZ91DRAFT_765656 [Kalaharituber pfeilii]|nr:hypothetical protein BDZ91DRAFT_765656 [Kalaharituber pfeilii]
MGAEQICVNFAVVDAARESSAGITAHGQHQQKVGSHSQNQETDRPSSLIQKRSYTLESWHRQSDTDVAWSEDPFLFAPPEYVLCSDVAKTGRQQAGIGIASAISQQGGQWEQKSWGGGIRDRKPEDVAVAGSVVHEAGNWQEKSRYLGERMRHRQVERVHVINFVDSLAERSRNTSDAPGWRTGRQIGSAGEFNDWHMYGIVRYMYPRYYWRP